LGDFSNYNNISSILILEPYGIGDAIVSTCLINPLKEKYPGVFVCALLHEKTGGLLDSTFDHVIYINPPWTISSGRYSPKNYFNRKFISKIKTLRSVQYDMIIDARCDFRLSLLMKILKGKIKVGFDYGLARYCYSHTVPYGKRSLRKDDYSKLLSALGILSSTCLPFIKIEEGSERFTKAKSILADISYSPKEYFIVHLGATWKYRRWNVENVSIVAKFINKTTGLKILAIGGHENEKAIDLLINEVEGVKLILPLDLLPYIILDSRFIVCNNTGVMHIADALNIPAVVIMGPTDRETWLPSREHLHLLFYNTDKYWCYPCNELTCFYPNNPCIENVSVKDVIHALATAFQKGWANMNSSNIRPWKDYTSIHA